MRRKQLAFLFVISFFLALLCVPTPVLAINRVVDQDLTHTCDSTATPPCYRTITAAVAGSTAGDTINVKSGSYNENVTIGINLTLRGTETAGTILSSRGGTIFSVTNGSTLSVANFAFQDAAIGIDISGTATVNAYNNIFLGITKKAIQLLSTPVIAPVIINNVFQQNNTAISTSATFLIKNNIFTGNTLAIDSVDATTTSITHNCFFGNTQNGKTGDTATNITSDPGYANASLGDFHLQTGSLCIDAGHTDLIYNDPASYPNTRNDIGAYGGPLTDIIPFPVSGVTAALATPLTDTVNVDWIPNLCYLVKGYNVYYDTTSHATSGTYSTTKDAGTTRPYQVPGLVATATAPTGAPVLSLFRYYNQTLEFIWTTITVSGAIGYEIRYKADADPPLPPADGETPNTTLAGTIDAGSATFLTLSGLTNGTTYHVAAIPYAQSVYYFAVKPYYTDTTTALGEFSNEDSETLGNKEYGLDVTAADIVTAFPEAITTYPNLPNKGCFIATAAYGHYSAPQVQALRKFRDEYLLTNAAGSAFVRWYYEQGPRAARFIDEHPSLKPVVRAALLPAVGGAMFMTGTSGPMKIVVAFCMMVVIGYFLSGRKFRRAGGRQ